MRVNHWTPRNSPCTEHKVRLGTAPKDYSDPQRFFDRTYLTQPLIGISSEVIRRLSGITTETSSVYNMTTQFGGGKTHALTLLYHLSKGGAGGNGWRGVSRFWRKHRSRLYPSTVQSPYSSERSSIRSPGAVVRTGHLCEKLRGARLLSNLAAKSLST